MLAQAAKNAGLRPLVIDLFSDLDMQRCADDFRQVPSLSEADITPALDYFIERYAVAHVIYGSGFESCPESLFYLASRLIILGNGPEIFLSVQNKPVFFAQLDKLAIAYPSVTFYPPECTEGLASQWLIKPMQSQGGIGIKRYRPGSDSVESAIYWQQYRDGTPHSVLFLADGRNVQVVGFNRQWMIDLGKDREFIFSGVINSTDLSNAQKELLTDWLNMLVPVYGLKGLNSLDFILTDEYLSVLEINARPSASMQLYDEDLLIRHIIACITDLSSEEITPIVRNSRCHTAYQIVYAIRDVIIPNGFDWPDGCMDLPDAGVICRAGQPICSIIARQNDSKHVLTQLLTLQQFIINKLERF